MWRQLPQMLVLPLMWITAFEEEPSIQRSPRYLFSRSLNGLEGIAGLYDQKRRFLCTTDVRLSHFALSKLPDLWLTLSYGDHQSWDTGSIASVLTTKIVPPSTRFHLLRTALTSHETTRLELREYIAPTYIQSIVATSRPSMQTLSRYHRSRSSKQHGSPTTGIWKERGAAHVQ